MGRIFFEREKSEVSHSVDVLGSQVGILKGLKKIGNSRQEELTILELGGQGGRLLLNFQRRGGLKCHPW